MKTSKNEEKKQNSFEENSEFYPLVSIIIPVFNGEKYIKEAVDSALAQTYKNIEIIVVDDGSQDKTEEILLSYGDKINYFKKENGGVATALNFAIKKAQGEYISWLSHDDIYLPNKVETQINVLRTLENKKTILYSSWQIISAEGKYVWSYEIDKNCEENILEKTSIDKSLYPLLANIISGCTLLVKKELFEEFDYFRTDLLTTQDYDLWFRMLQKYPIKYCPGALIKTRVHEEQGSKALKAFNIREGNDLWNEVITSLSLEELDNLFPNKEAFLSLRSKQLYEGFFFDSAADMILKISQLHQTKTNILVINFEKAQKKEQKEPDKNIFYLDITEDKFEFYINETIIFEFKLKSPMSFKHRNMFLQNEATSLIEKLIVAFNIDLLHLYKIQDVGFDIVNVANKLSVPVIYHVCDLKTIWLNPDNESVQSQINLFANKYIFTNIAHTFVEKNNEESLKSLIFSQKVNYSVLDSKEFSSELKTLDFYNMFLESKKKIVYPESIRKILINDFLKIQDDYIRNFAK